MNQSHTPGPWDKDYDYGHEFIISTSDGATVCEVASDGELESDAVANARLISAAPELLDALKIMVAAFVATNHKHDAAEYNCVIAARNAISKATGGVA